MKFMLDDAKPVVAVCTAGFGQRLDGLGVQVIEVDDPAIATQPADPLPEPEAANLAYLIYTSGTTGTPKAVAITHHNITELFAGLHPDLQPLPGQVWAQCHSHAFDVSVWEMWSALLHGGRLVIVPDEVTRSPTELLACWLMKVCGCYVRHPRRGMRCRPPIRLTEAGSTCGSRRCGGG
ncbi:AMP-binding enzyme family protein [Mycobacterium kansasii]|uniref:AMP-binding enzyme family protein n=1 Tax=Mycobacterium kansasii TaxID=1768 RepID=A0A1V3WDI5_MYCKA|nr:AMP-binding enzyme family protein [Mycobacterium kansasii]